MRRATRRVAISAMVVACALAACTTDPGVRATQSEARAKFADEAVPLDSHTRILTLDNGLTVYLRHNERPGLSAELRLVVNAGSAQETPDQAGVAHFLEHMMFNGTEQFPTNDLIDVLRSFGMQFGADINAYTSYDETVYELKVPTDDEQNLPTGLDVLAQWLSAATLKDADVTDERGVVLDEWRVREQTFAGRAGVAWEDMYLHGTGYDGRAPIGNDGAIQQMTPAPLRAFYDAWYRPDNAAVMVVGDVDVAEVEALIHERFDAITARGGSPERAAIPVGPFDEPSATVVADPDTLATSVTLSFPTTAPVVTTTGQMRDLVLAQLALDMIANRLGDDVTRGDAAFRSSSTATDRPVRPLLARGVSLEADPSATSDTIDAVAVEFERARRYGFDDVEFARAVAYYLSEVQSAYESRDTVADGTYIGAMVDHFLTAAPLTDARWDHDTYTALLDSVTAADAGAALQALLDDSAPFMFVTAPDTIAGLPTSADLLQLLNGLPAREIEPRAATAAVGDQLMARPEPVKEVSSDAVLAADLFIDGTRLVFPNGAVVILNRTDIGQDDIAIEARSIGGTAALAPGDVDAARYAVEVAAGSGVGQLDQVQVDTVLNGATLQVQPYLADHYEGFYGGSSSGDLELAFQLLHLYMTAPRFQQNALDTAKEADRPYIDAPLGDPDFATYDALIRARYGDDNRYLLVPTADAQDAITLAAVERTYRERFAHPKDWVFVLSGDLDVDAATDLARRYIGTIEGDDVVESHGANAAEPPDGVVDREVRSGTGDTASLSLLYTEPSDGGQLETLYSDLLTQVLTNRLTDHIREELGASYSPYAYIAVDEWPEQNVQTYVSVSGAPADMQRIADTVEADIDDIVLNGPTQAELDAAVAAVTENYDLFDNDTVAMIILRMEHDPELKQQLRRARGAAETVRVFDVRTFAAKVLKAHHRIKVVQLPAS